MNREIGVNRKTLKASGASEESLADFFAQHQAELLGTLYHLVGNQEDARDALQEAFIKCWRHRQKLSEIENLRAWVFRVALNTGRDVRAAAWKRRRRNLPEDNTMVDIRAADVPAELEKSERLGRLRAAVGDLRTVEQEVFLLRQNGELTYEQIAVTLQIPIGTVKTRMRTALQKLRTVLSEL